MRCSQRAAHQELAAAWRAAGLCQSAAAGMLHCEEAASVASSPLCLGLLGPERAVLGSCMTAVSMVLSPMRPCGVQIV